MTADSTAADRQRVVVVTGGGAGIGAAIAEAIGRSGAYVVTVDPGVTVDGLGQDEGPAETTADRIVAAGGAARASNASVTDAAAIDALFAGLVDEFGGLDAVINVAGISRPSGFAEGDEQAWTSVLSVHLDGYLNVLRAGAADHDRGRTRPHPGCHLGLRLATRQRGRVQLREAGGCRAHLAAREDRAARGHGERAVADRGDAHGDLGPPPAGAGTSAGDQSQTGGLSLALAAMPSPEELGPVGAYLGERRLLRGARGTSSSPTVPRWRRSLPPRVLEVMRGPPTSPTLRPCPRRRHPGGVRARRGGAGDQRRQQRPVRRRVRRDLPGEWWRIERARAVVPGRHRRRRAGSPRCGDALASRGVKCRRRSARLAPATDFVGAAEQLAQAARDAGGVDAVVVARAGLRRQAAPARAGSRCSTSTRESSTRSAATWRGCGR